MRRMKFLYAPISYFVTKEVGLAKVKFPTSLREEQQQLGAIAKSNCCSSKQTFQLQIFKEQIVRTLEDDDGMVQANQTCHLTQ
jgi:hypothetical protein